MSGAGEVLLASVFYQRQEDGSRKRYRHGDAVADLPKAVAERLRRIGAIGEAVGAVDLEAESLTGAPKPDEDATKADLIAWLVDNAVDADGADYTTSKLQPLNKAALWELINAVED